MNNIYKRMGFDLIEAFCWFFVCFVCFCKIALMHPLFREADQLSHTAIGAAIEVHRLKGPGDEKSYRRKRRKRRGRAESGKRRAPCACRFAFRARRPFPQVLGQTVPCL